MAKLQKEKELAASNKRKFCDDNFMNLLLHSGEEEDTERESVCDSDLNECDMD
jgi:hypothetical protein